MRNDFRSRNIKNLTCISLSLVTDQCLILPTHHMYLMLYIHVFFQGINQELLEMVDLKESNESENDTTVPNHPIKMIFLLLPFWQGQYIMSAIMLWLLY